MNDNKKKKQQGQQEAMSPYAQIQPQAPEVEKAVLGALMIDKDAYVVVCEILKPKSFYEPRHQKIYEAIERLSINEKPIDVLTVTEQLAKGGTLEEVGGAAYIAELSSKVATSANIVYHANIIAEKYLFRQMINYANTIGTKAYDETNDVKDVIMEAERILFEIAQTNMKKDYTDIKTLVGMSALLRSLWRRTSLQIRISQWHFSPWKCLASSCLTVSFPTYAKSKAERFSVDS
jgi:replicative DNA helicase